MYGRITRWGSIVSFWVLLGIALAACAPAPTPVPPAEATPTPPAEEAPVTITVWDYYGEATPIEPLIAAFEAENPNIKIQYEPLDWDSINEKFVVAVSGGNSPDVVTVDMTWVPGWAPLGVFADLAPFAQGELNGVPLDEAFTAGQLESMRLGDQIVTMFYDFDVYSLYYRADIFEEKGLEPPTTWDELIQVGKQLAEDTNGDGRADRCAYLVAADTFHFSQFLFENGGSLLTPDNSAAAFNSPEGIEALRFYTDLILKEGIGMHWTEEDAVGGVKDGRICMFSDGPYYMGVLAAGAPEMAGKIRVAPHPGNVRPGSYLGGTGLSTPAGAPHPAAAWKFIEFAMRPENQIGVYTYAGAAPGLRAALESEEVNQPNEYLGGQRGLPVFLEATETAHHFPYVKQWAEIDEVIGAAVEAVLLEEKTPQQALEDAAAEVNAILSR